MDIEKRDLLGVWRLRSAEFHTEGEDILYLWGKKPVGYLIYTESGHMSATLTNSERVPFAAENPLEASLEELAQAARNYLAYIGTYTLTGNTIIHHVEACIFPNWAGEQQVRFIEDLTENTLVLRSTPTHIAGRERVGYIQWTRPTLHASPFSA